MVKVRFAPSPTGHLHIGSTRTALFNYLFARHHKGTFILRIEDTDQKRSQDEFLNSILNDLHWLGLNWDEELYFQSKRLKIYEEYAQKLLKEGKAFVQDFPNVATSSATLRDAEETLRRETAFGTADSVQRSGAIIFKMPSQKIKINDLIHKEIEFDTSLLGDQVLIKSDGRPAYNFACVIDDAAMDITHVIRGDDHISNTPKQIMFYQALGFKLPFFAHIPLILDVDKSRLSKRQGATSIAEFRAEGFLPEALLNYLALLGWSPGNNQEFFSLDEAISRFDLKKVNKTQAVFDLKKLTWLNHEYLKKYDSEKLLNIIEPQLREKKCLPQNYDRNWLLNVIKLFQPRLNLLNDFFSQADFVFLDKINYDPEAFQEFILKDKEKILNILKNLTRPLESSSSFEANYLEQLCRGLAEKLNIKTAEIIHPLRLILSGKTVTPGLFETMAVLGKEKVLTRIKQVLEKI